MNKVAIIILNWNGRELLERFLPSVIAHSPTQTADIIVADNGSTDDSLDMLQRQFPAVRLLPLDRNYGFAEGYNRALQQTTAPYAVLLNNDVEVTDGWLDAPLALLNSDASVAAVQPKLRSWLNKARFDYAGAAGGFLDRYGYPFCRGRILHVVEDDRGQYDTPIDILWASGACLFIRTDVFRAVGGFDPRFFAHQEEIDLCWRMRCRGYRLLCVPQSVVYHVGGATLDAENPRKTFLNFRNSLLMVYKNTPAADLPHVLRRRRLLDAIALLRFLCLGHWRDADAVLRARQDFRRLKPHYRSIRLDNLRHTSRRHVPCLFPHCLILYFYLKRKRRYCALENAIR